MADSADGSRALLAAEPAAVQRLLQLVGADDCPADTAAALGEAIGSLATHAVAAFEEDGAAAEAAAGLGRLLHRRRGPALRAHAARALWRLARNAPSAQAAICAAGCLPLLAALKGSCTEAEQLALGCLRELAANPDNAPAFWCVGGLRVLSSGWGCISGAAAEAALNPAALEWATRMRGSSMEWPENEECNSVVLSVDAAAALAEALAVNVTLLDLRIGDIAEGADDLCAELLADALKINSSLEDLYLNNNQISDVGAAALGEGLKINSSLTTLSLMNNHIGSVGAAALCKGLECNSNLSYLDLNDNHISDVGAAALGEVLKRNSTLTTLCLSCNLIGDVGVTALADGLESNSTLETLFLLDNQISDVGITALGKGLRSNSTLKNLILRDNPFSSAAVTTLRKWLESNTTLHLDYSDLISANAGGCSDLVTCIADPTFHELTQCAIGARVTLTWNLCSEKGAVNGADGTVSAMRSDEARGVYAIDVDLDGFGTFTVYKQHRRFKVDGHIKAGKRRYIDAHISSPPTLR